MVLTQLLPRNRDESGRTALILAAKWGHAECVEHLLAAWANRDTVYTDKTALNFAEQKGHADIAALLRAPPPPRREPPPAPEPEPEPEKSPSAIADEIRAIVATLSAEVKQEMASELALACRAGDEAGVARLVRDGADTSATDPSGLPLVQVAARRGYAGVLTQLGSYSMPSQIGDALIDAAESGHGGCIDALLRVGADVNGATPSRGTPLIAAACLGFADCVGHLLVARADVAPVHRGCSALEWASELGHYGVVELLRHPDRVTKVRNWELQHRETQAAPKPSVGRRSEEFADTFPRRGRRKANSPGPEKGRTFSPNQHLVPAVRAEAHFWSTFRPLLAHFRSEFEHSRWFLGRGVASMAESRGRAYPRRFIGQPPAEERPHPLALTARTTWSTQAWGPARGLGGPARLHRRDR